LTAFSALSPFSMTERADLSLISGGSITGFNQAMESGVPEPSQWILLTTGFALMGVLGFRKRRNARLAF
jgi:hypothetical protein